MQVVYRDHVPVLQAKKNCFGKFHSDDINIKDELCPERLSNIYNDVLPTLTSNNARISTEVVVETQQINQSTAFRNSNKMGITLNFNILVHRCPKKTSWMVSPYPFLCLVVLEKSFWNLAAKNGPCIQTSSA